MSRRNLRGFNFERLENRRLLAADFGAEVIQCDFMPAETCEVASAFEVEDGNMEVETEGTEIGNCFDSEVDDVVENGSTNETETDIVEDASEDLSADDNSESTEIVSEDQIDDSVIELQDPVLGTSGYFGELSFENPSTSMMFTPSEEGTIDIVIASSLDESSTILEVTDSSGNLIEATATEQMEGFQKLTIEAVEGETYQLTVSSSEEMCNVHFMVTAEFNPTPQPVDLHADEIGEQSTEMEFIDGIANLNGELEFAGDIDTFRLVADADGRAILHLAETLSDNATELNVTVYDANGAEVARGLTNEKVMVSFDATEGCEYFVAVHASEDQIGVYELRMEMESSPVDLTPVDLHADEIGEGATLLTLENGTASVSGALETAEDRDAFRVVADADGEMVVDVNATSENHTSDASVSVFGPDGELVVAGGTNDEVAIRFDSNSNVEYQVLIDSTNDIPADYELTINSFANEIEPLETVDDIPVEDGTVLDEGQDLQVEDDMIVCFSDDIENGLVDEVFTEFGENLETDLEKSRRAFKGRLGNRGFRQI